MATHPAGRALEFAARTEAGEEACRPQGGGGANLGGHSERGPRQPERAHGKRGAVPRRRATAARCRLGEGKASKQATPAAKPVKAPNAGKAPNPSLPPERA